MFYCENCKKEVVLYSVGRGTVPDETILEKMAQNIEKQGKLILFNPPPLETYNCPNCFSKLIEK